jgi:hypothetical protein
MSERPSPEGSAPEITSAEVLADVIERAFDYRGDVTVGTRDGVRHVGYLFNRQRDSAVPFIQLLPAGGGEARTISYAEIQSIAFTGRDTAAGNSYAAWVRRKQAGAEAPASPADGTPSPDA